MAEKQTLRNIAVHSQNPTIIHCNYLHECSSRAYLFNVQCSPKMFIEFCLIFFPFERVSFTSSGFFDLRQKIVIGNLELGVILVIYSYETVSPLKRLTNSQSSIDPSLFAEKKYWKIRFFFPVCSLPSIVICGPEDEPKNYQFIAQFQ